MIRSSSRLFLAMRSGPGGLLERARRVVVSDDSTIAKHRRRRAVPQPFFTRHVHGPPCWIPANAGRRTHHDMWIKSIVTIVTALCALDLRVTILFKRENPRRNLLSQLRLSVTIQEERDCERNRTTSISTTGRSGLNEDSGSTDGSTY